MSSVSADVRWLMPTSTRVQYQENRKNIKKFLRKVEIFLGIIAKLWSYEREEMVSREKTSSVRFITVNF